MRYATPLFILMLLAGCATSMQQAMEDAYRSNLPDPAVEVAYDEVENITRHSVGPFVLSGLDSVSTAPAVIMNVAAGCEGDNPCSGEDLGFAISSSSDEWKFLNNHQVRLYVPGSSNAEAVRLNPESEHNGETSTSQYAATVSETVVFALTDDEVSRVLDPPSNAVMRVGTYTYRFPDEVETKMSEYVDTFSQ